MLLPNNIPSQWVAYTIVVLIRMRADLFVYGCVFAGGIASVVDLGAACRNGVSYVRYICRLLCVNSRWTVDRALRS